MRADTLPRRILRRAVSRTGRDCALRLREDANNMYCQFLPVPRRRWRISSAVTSGSCCWPIRARGQRAVNGGGSLGFPPPISPHQKVLGDRFFSMADFCQRGIASVRKRFERGLSRGNLQNRLCERFEFMTRAIRNGLARRLPLRGLPSALTRCRPPN